VLFLRSTLSFHLWNQVEQKGAQAELRIAELARRVEEQAKETAAAKVSLQFDPLTLDNILGACSSYLNRRLGNRVVATKAPPSRLSYHLDCSLT
jgi:predicted glycoside hydrolase/deacetylase ChbG (UPF0249 family)